MKIIRQIVDTSRSPIPHAVTRYLFQGEVNNKDYVSPDTVKVFFLCENDKGEDLVGPEITSSNKSANEQKMRNRVAVNLTKLYRKTHANGDNK